MKSAPAFQFYAKDWLVDTAGLSLKAQGAYVRLLAHEWTEGPLANDRPALARRCGVSPKEFAAIWREIGALFQVDGEMLVNRRLEQERAKQEAYRADQAVRGKHGASKRWNMAPALPDAMPPAMPTPSPDVWPVDGSPYSIPQLQDRSFLEASNQSDDGEQQDDGAADRKRMAFKVMLEQPARGAA